MASPGFGGCEGISGLPCRAWSVDVGLCSYLRQVVAVTLISRCSCVLAGESWMEVCLPVTVCGWSGDSWLSRCLRRELAAGLVSPVSCVGCALGGLR